MKFDLKKAKYSYQLFSSDDDYTNDVDCIRQIQCNDGFFRWIALEVKHEKEDLTKVTKQVKTLQHILNADIPIVVCTLDVDESILVDGKITKGSETVYETKTAWFDVNKCKIKAIYAKGDFNMFVGLTVETFLNAVKAGLFNTDKINGIEVEKWYEEM